MKRSEWELIVAALIWYTQGDHDMYVKATALAKRIQSQLDNPIVVKED